MATLTAKQENFAQYIVDGFTQLEAYKRAYDAENMLDKTISNNAYELVNKREVAGRIAQLRDQLAERLLYPRLERLKDLKAIAKNAERDSDKVSAIKVVSEMLDDKTPQKLAIEHSGETTQKTITILNAEDIDID